jgi:hypothetical protein
MNNLLHPRRRRRKPPPARSAIKRTVPYVVRRLIERFRLPAETAVEIAVAAGFRLEAEQ